jgi:hypothetical protein
MSRYRFTGGSNRDVRGCSNVIVPFAISSPPSRRRRRPLADGRRRRRYLYTQPRTRLVQGQPAQLAGAAAAVAVSGQVERVGELPFLRLVAPLNGRGTGNVIGLAPGANRRGARGPGFVMSRGRGRVRRLLEWIAKQSKSQDAPPIIPMFNTEHNSGRFGCLQRAARQPVEFTRI